jgi:hypothetical protein
MEILGRRQLFQTTDGRFGLTIRGVLPGDCVCVLNGSPTTHVIRRASGKDKNEMKTWRFVGENGLMKGEADETEVEDNDIVFV